MKKRIRKIGDWDQWKSNRDKHNIEMLTINMAVIISVFVAAIIIQP